MTTTTARPGHPARIIPADAARAVGRFRTDGPIGYQASNYAGAPIRAHRDQAEEDWQLHVEGAPKAGDYVRVVTRHGGEVRTGLATITGGVRPHPDRSGWYVCWMRQDTSTIGTAGGAYVPGPDDDQEDQRVPGILAVPVEQSRCRHCRQPIYSDPYDSRGDQGDAIWRTRNGYGVCSGSNGETWHRPDSDHQATCCWLTRCPTCTPWAAR